MGFSGKLYSKIDLNIILKMLEIS